jgi:hypothetical protein
MNFGNPNMKWVLLVGGLLVCAVCAVVATGGNLLRGNPTSPVVVGAPTPFPPLSANDSPNVGTQLSEVVTARSVGEGNVPLEVTDRFSMRDPVIYAVAQGNIPSGTQIFARWSREGSPFEDTTEIVADRDYRNTYIEFHISPNGQALAPGNYAVQFFVDGNPGPGAQFTVS